jgi:ABC-2 type transport system ATP-binding protein
MHNVNVRRAGITLGGPPPAGQDTGQHAAMDADRELAVSVANLRMSYGTHEAVRGIDLQVAPGEILGFLGPNGAGKTSTVEILEGFRRRTGGDVRVLGTDPARAGSAWRARIGVVLQTCEPERRLTVRECLSMYAGYYPRPLPVGRVLDLVGLSGSASADCSQLSGGQKRRLDVALALIGDPELIFLDEPTTGFDPSARHLTWDVIRGLRDLGKTIFLTTHFMDEAEALADRILILAAGRIVASGTPATIGGRAASASEIEFTLPDGLSVTDLPPLPVPVSSSRPGRVRLSAAEPMHVLHALSSWAMQRGLPVSDLSVHRPSLEEIYLRLTESPAPTPAEEEP